MPDDGAAVQRAREGDQDATRELYEKHVDFVFRLVRPRVAEREEALEAVQEIFLTASRRLPASEPEDDFGSWLAAIALEEVGVESRTSDDTGAGERRVVDERRAGDPPGLTDPERAYIYEAVRRRRSMDPWRPLWKIVLAAALLLLLLGLWHLQRALAGP